MHSQKLPSSDWGWAGAYPSSISCTNNFGLVFVWVLFFPQEKSTSARIVCGYVRYPRRPKYFKIGAEALHMLKVLTDAYII